MHVLGNIKKQKHKKVDFQLVESDAAEVTMSLYFHG
jgi:hypothetical protein